MAEVANFSPGAPRDLLRDIADSPAGDGVMMQPSGNGDLCILDRFYAVAEPPRVHTLSGLCRWSVRGIDVEVEMVSSPDNVRSVLYLGAGQGLHVFTPPGTYRFRYRFLSPPGRYDARLTVNRETFIQRLSFYTGKAARLLRRGPRALWAAAAAVMAPRDGVMASRGGPTVGAGTFTDIPARPSILAPSGALPSVSIVIPTRDRRDLLEACIESLRRLEGVTRDIIVVDNGSIDPGTVEYLARLATQPGMTVLRLDIPFNFSRLCNAGAAIATREAVLFLNDDIEALDGIWLARMLAWLGDPEVGTVGARLLYPSQDLQHAGIATNLVPGPGHPWRGAPPQVWRTHPLTRAAGEVDAVTGACLLVRRTDFQAVGGFDEQAFAITLNDVDLCLKLRRRGLKSLYVPEATLVHKEGQSRADDHSPAERERRRRELKAFFELYPDFARQSCFYPQTLRRDSDQALPF